MKERLFSYAQEHLAILPRVSIPIDGVFTHISDNYQENQAVSALYGLTLDQ